jgi:O-antigen/teichoic acid export membrane protein
MRLGRTTIVHFLSQVGVSLAGFVATLAIAKLLGPGPLGVYAVVVALTLWLNVPAAAIGGAVSKRLSEVDGPGGALVTTGLVLTVGVTGGLCLLVLAARDVVVSYIGANVTELFAALLLVNATFTLAISVLNGQKRVDLEGVLSTVERVLRTVLQVGLILGVVAGAAGVGVAGLVAGHVAALAVATAIGGALIYSRDLIAVPTRAAAASLLSYARYDWLDKLTGKAFGWMDTLVLALFVPSSLIGIYEVSWNLASMLALVSVSIQRTLFPEVSDLGVQNVERVRHYLDEGLAFTGVFVIPGLAGAAVLGRRVLKIYDPAFTQGATILLVLIIGRMAAAYSSQLRSVISGLDRPELTFQVNLVFIVANVGLNLLLVGGLTVAGYPPAIAWYGAAAATFLSALLTALLALYALSTIIGRPPLPLGEISRQAVAAAVMAGTLLLARPFVPANNYTTVALVGLGGGVYIAILLGVSTRARDKAAGLYRSVRA